MTTNQIAYRQLEEAKRSNLANEQIKEDQLVETKRANVENEAIKRKEAAAKAVQAMTNSKYPAFHYGALKTNVRTLANKQTTGGNVR